MKTFKVIVSAFFLFNILIANAQTTYLSSHFMQVGDSMLYSRQTSGLNSFNFDTTGANISWDFSTVGYQTQNNTSYIDPNNSGYKNVWCANNNYGPFSCSSNFGILSNLAIRSLDSLSLGEVSITNRVSHQLISSDALQDQMVGITAEVSGIPIPFSFEYQNADSIYQFPFQFNKKDSSTSRVVFDLFPAPIVQSRNTKRTNLIEGWGSLTTPYGTFSNILKMKTIIERTDTLFLDTLVLPTTVTRIEYKWWDLNFGLPVFIASGNMVGQTPVISSVQYLDSVRCVNPQSLFSYTPLTPTIDPVSKSVQVDFINLSTNADSVIWDLGDGTISTDFSPTHTYFCQGIQNIRLITFNNCDSTILSDTASLPLFISDSSSSNSLDTNVVSICDGDSILINGDFQNSPGFYFDVKTGVNGCDSTSFVRLKINSTPDTSVTVKADTLIAADSLIYQWLDCNNGFAPILGATGQQFTPISSGFYAVEVNENGCSAISSCFEITISSIPYEFLVQEFKIYPNPAKNYITIVNQNEVDKEYSIYSLTGQEIIRTKTNTIPLNDLQPGIYMLRVVDVVGNTHQQLFQKQE